ncbi:6360_t:CDS:2 [Ambispora gerdemannii]|uniref:6360_t:CDS:1 n=1 Tax=Ambispora gerdemannii TaxID=144530 RepID=A0A9N9B3E3_9GLOM|nr:6360_t:CDS:2 [Ambispora gerdemannii]
MDEDFEFVSFERQESIEPDESISQISATIIESDISILNANSSTVWLHFIKTPMGTQCTICHQLYKPTSGVSTLRSHLRKHQLENIYFRAMLSYFCPRYKIPNRHEVKDMTIEIFNTRHAKISTDLASIPGKIALTADMWTSTINREAFLGITIHYIDFSWNLCNFLLDIIPFKISHTGVNIANTIIDILQEHNLLEKTLAIITDNASVMIVCGREIAKQIENDLSQLTFAHYRCAAHIMNIIKKSDSLRQYCITNGVTYLKPILDVKTRWNSTYYMLERFITLESVLFLLAKEYKSIQEIYPNENELKIIKDMIIILEPFERATKHLSASSYPTLADVRFIFEGIQVYLNNLIGQNEFTQSEFASLIHQKIEEY